ncbi:MAG: type III secretion protein [Deltaproteobacteria bacterium]|nr:type III secretion protein [Deltaproteobacteria bacterium]
MSAYPLAALISIRELREEGAKKALLAAEEALKQALAQEERAQKALDKWRQYVIEETERRWSGLLGRPTDSQGLTGFREGLSDLALREADFVEKVLQAQKVTQEKRDQLVAAREELVARRRAKEKLESHRELWLAEAAKESERQEGLELEEYSRPLLAEEQN